MEEKQAENFIRRFERHTFWKKFREGALIGMLRFISFFMAFSCIGILLLLSVIGKRIDQIDNFMPFIQIVFIFYAVLNTDFFAEETIEGINVPEFEKFLEENDLYGMKIDSRIVNEFLEEEKVELIEKLN